MRFSHFHLSPWKPRRGGPPPSEREERRLYARTPANVAATIEWAGDDGGVASEAAWIRDSSAHGMGLTATCELPVGRIVWVARESAPMIKATIRHCRRAEDAFRLGVEFVERERRRLDRDPASGRAMLRWTGDVGRGEQANAEVRNIAEGGLQVSSERPVPAGIAIKLTGDQFECVGSVRYCIPRGNRFLIGLQFIGEPYVRTPEAPSR